MQSLATQPFVVVSTVAALALGLAGCAVQQPDEPEIVAAAHEAWDTTCVGSTPDFHYGHTGSFSESDGWTATDCYKGIVVLIDDLTMTTGVDFKWTSTPPATEAACVSPNTFLGVYAWSADEPNDTWILNNGGEPWKLYGFWNNIEMKCVPPELHLTGSYITNNDKTVFAITARTSDSSSASTVAFSFDAE